MIECSVAAALRNNLNASLCVKVHCAEQYEVSQIKIWKGGKVKMRVVLPGEVFHLFSKEAECS